MTTQKQFMIKILAKFLFKSRKILEANEPFKVRI